MIDQVEEIKRRVDIVDLIGSYIPLKKAGRNFKAICPFHQEKTPSFIVSPERQIWHCFGACNEGGDIFKFLMKWENITFFEALKILAKKAGIKLKKVDFEDKDWKKKQILLEINNLALQYFIYVLKKTKYGEKALNYLKERRIKSTIIDKFQIGYAPFSWRSLFIFLKKRGFSSNDIINSGLVVKNNSNYYDRFRGRLIFPIKNIQGQIIGFSGRIMTNKEDEAKYINSPETFIYHKRQSLFGIDLAKDSIRKKDFVYLVEGEFDMISCFQIGIENVLAVKGTAVTEEQLELIKKLTKRINLFLDADQAGIEAVKKVIPLIEKYDFEAKVIKIDFAKDPDEAIKKNIALFKKNIKKKVPIYDFIFERLLEKYSINDPFGRKKITEEMINYLEEIRNPVVQSFYVKKLASTADLKTEIIEKMIYRLKYQKKTKKFYQLIKKQTKEKNRNLILQKYLLSYLLQSNQNYQQLDKIKEILKSENFSLPVYQKIFQALIDYHQKNKEFDINHFAKDLPSEIQVVLNEIYLFISHQSFEGKEKIEKIAYEIKKNFLKEELSKLLKKDSEDKKIIIDLSKELKEVEKKINLI